jgi:TIR domain
MYIFLAYASEDKEAAESIAYSLRSRRHKVFLDHDDLPPGASYDQQIERAVKESDIFIFLISPTSVAEGRYTLSELNFARQQWPDPNGRVLPVMTRKTPAKNVPSYLKAVTILEPRGNIAAETSAAVDNMRHGSSQFRYRNTMVAGVLCAVALMLAYIIIISIIRPRPPGPIHTAQDPYGIYVTGVTDPQTAVREAEKVKSIAQSIGREGNEIRLYKRRVPGTGSYLWAIVIVYTDSTVASSEVSRYEPERNKWDPDVVNLHSWCPNSRPISSPTGTEIQFPILDCT